MLEYSPGSFLDATDLPFDLPVALGVKRPREVAADPNGGRGSFELPCVVAFEKFDLLS